MKSLKKASLRHSLSTLLPAQSGHLPATLCYGAASLKQSFIAPHSIIQWIGDRSVGKLLISCSGTKVRFNVHSHRLLTSWS